MDTYIDTPEVPESMPDLIASEELSGFSIVVVIPAFNEERFIVSVVLKTKKYADQIIVVDDGSSDNTAKVAANANAKVIVHDRCRGYGASLKTGARVASGDYIGFCDGDGQHSSEDMLRLINECNGYDMVVGTRGKDSYTSLARKPGKLVMRYFANFVAGQKITW